MTGVKYRSICNWRWSVHQLEMKKMYIYYGILGQKGHLPSFLSFCYLFVCPYVSSKSFLFDLFCEFLCFFDLCFSTNFFISYVFVLCFISYVLFYFLCFISYVLFYFLCFILCFISYVLFYFLCFISYVLFYVLFPMFYFISYVLFYVLFLMFYFLCFILCFIFYVFIFFMFYFYVLFY